MLLVVGLPVAVSELGDEGTQLICRSLYRKTALQHISLQGGAGVWVLGRGSWMCCPICWQVVPSPPDLHDGLAAVLKSWPRQRDDVVVFVVHG